MIIVLSLIYLLPVTSLDFGLCSGITNELCYAQENKCGNIELFDDSDTGLYFSVEASIIS